MYIGETCYCPYFETQLRLAALLAIDAWIWCSHWTCNILVAFVGYIYWDVIWWCFSFGHVWWECDLVVYFFWICMMGCYIYIYIHTHTHVVWTYLCVSRYCPNSVNFLFIFLLKCCWNIMENSDIFKKFYKVGVYLQGQTCLLWHYFCVGDGVGVKRGFISKQ